MERLSGLDATFLYVETPSMHMHVSLLAVLDPSDAPGGYDYGRIHGLIERQLGSLPQLRRRLLEVPLGLHHPVWVDDPHFDVVHHVRRVACPAPGGQRELAELCGRINSTPLDRARPLWELWMIEGLANGQFALFVKIHHAVADGMGGAALLVSMFSPTRDAPPLGTARAPVAAVEPLPTPKQLIVDALRARFAKPSEVAQLFRKTSQALHEAIDKRHENPDNPLPVPFVDVPRTRFNGPVTAQRSVAFARIALSDIKRVRKAFDATLNDVVLAVCAGTLHRYLEARGELPLTALVAACPVSVRSPDQVGHNHVSALFTSLATNVEDPVARLAAISRAAREAKAEHSALGGEMMGNWAELLSPVMFSAASQLYSKYHLAHLHRPFYNLVVSNVPGPPIPMYLAGSRLVAAYPLGPVMEGIGLNVTVMSYVDHVDFGFVTATSLLPDAWELAGEVEPALQELLTPATRALASAAC